MLCEDIGVTENRMKLITETAKLPLRFLVLFAAGFVDKWSIISKFSFLVWSTNPRIFTYPQYFSFSLFPFVFCVRENFYLIYI